MTKDQIIKQRDDAFALLRKIIGHRDTKNYPPTGLGGETTCICKFCGRTTHPRGISRDNPFCENTECPAVQARELLGYWKNR